LKKLTFVGSFTGCPLKVPVQPVVVKLNVSGNAPVFFMKIPMGLGVPGVMAPHVKLVQFDVQPLSL
jgi:hypothetical protein